MGETLVWDSEADNLLEASTKVHMVQLGTLDGTDCTVYTAQPWPGCRPLAEGLARLKAADKLIGHNSVVYDYELIEKFYPGTLRRSQIVDTLVMVRLLDPEQRENSLDALGMRLGVLKGAFKGPWDVVTQEMVDYAANDVTVGRAVYNHAKAVLDWGQSFEIEMETAWAIAAQVRNGFCFDIKAAQELEATLRGEVAEMTVTLQDTFPPRYVAKKEKGKVVVCTPSANFKSRHETKGAPFSRVSLEVFNPGSRAQVADRLKGLGWRPKAFGQSGQPTVDEKVLAELPYAEAKRLVGFFTTQKLLGQLSDGDNGWLKLVTKEGRLHGFVNPNGAATGRMSHSKPNLAQVAKDPRARALFIPRPGWKLVGCDAEGLEARMLAHYLARWDKGAYADMLLNGDKAKGTDVHSANAKAVQAAGFAVDRDGSKTLLYALSYGAGDAKLGLTVVENLRAQGKSAPKASLPFIGKQVRAAMSRAMVGFDKLTDAVKAKAKSAGYLIGLDGRRLPVRSEHSALNTLLQGGGAIVMKRSLVDFMDSALVHENWPDMGLCANVHDEIEIECIPELAEAVGSELADAIRRAGEHFNLRCPLAGAYAIGNSWLDVH